MMSTTTADEIARLAETINLVLEGPEGLCLNVNPAGDPSRWVQYVDGQLNAATFEATQPEALLARLGGVEFIDFEPGKYLTVNLTSRDPEALAAWIHAYLRDGLRAPDGAALELTTEQL